MKDKKEILKGLLLSEQDTLNKFAELVKKSRKLFGIEEKTKKIIIHNPNLYNDEKIIIMLIGKYFSKELDLIDSSEMTSRDISDELSIKITTISAPLGKLVQDGYVRRDDEKYKVNFYKVDEILERLNAKYDKYEMKITPGLKTSRRKPVSKNNKSVKSSKTNLSNKKRRIKKKEIRIPKITFSESPRSIADLAKDLDVTLDKLRIVFDYDENDIHLLRKKHKNKDSEEAFFNAILILTSIYYHKYSREIKVTDLKKMLKDVKVSLNDKFKRDMGLAFRRPFIFEKGDSYKITDSGIKLGLSLIKEFIDD